MSRAKNRLILVRQALRSCSLIGLAIFGLLLCPAEAQDAVNPTPRFKPYGWIESGITVNPDAPADRQNFGQLLTDRSNELLLNQAVVMAERTLASSADHFDWGFKLQLLHGSDARYLHSLGILDNTQHEIVQPDLVEAWFLLHFPIANTAGGFDMKIGKFVTLEGAETIDPRTNIFIRTVTFLTSAFRSITPAFLALCTRSTDSISVPA